MLVVLVQVRVRHDMLAEFERAIFLNAEGAREREAGCLRFDVSQSEEDPSQWLFYEVYRDAAAFDTHRASPHFAAYQQVAERALLSKSLTRWSLRSPQQ